MKKNKLILMSLLFISFQSWAIWAPLSLSNLVKHSDLIVLAEYDKELSLKIGNNGSKWQTIQFKVIQSIKGGIKSKTIKVHGWKTGKCVPQCFFENMTGDKMFMFLGYIQK
ncbi:MAG: hypothetical protein HRT89_21495 [Lentisphaeria bacterium]|nr:hypothetical protein [Lentisphaeria bacterium]